MEAVVHAEEDNAGGHANEQHARRCQGGRRRALLVNWEGGEALLAWQIGKKKSRERIEEMG